MWEWSSYKLCNKTMTSASRLDILLKSTTSLRVLGRPHGWNTWSQSLHRKRPKKSKELKQRSQPLRSHHSLCLRTGKHLCKYIKTIEWCPHQHWAAPLLLWSVPVTSHGTHRRSDFPKKQEMSNVSLPSSHQIVSEMMMFKRSVCLVSPLFNGTYVGFCKTQENGNATKCVIRFKATLD